MTQPLDFLSESEVRQISSLVNALDRSSFDYFQIDVGDGVPLISVQKVTVRLPSNGAGPAR